MSSLQTLKARWTGLRPLVMHNGRLCDPLDPIAKQIAEITAKGSKKRTTADLERLYRLEWEGGLYHDPVKGPFIPSENIEACVRDGAKKSRRGEDVKACVFVQDPIVVLNYAGPRDMDGLYNRGSPKFCFRRSVVIKGSRIIRMRPIFQEWSIAFTVEYDDSILSAEDMATAMVNAGTLCGLGDARPKFGRFLCEFLS